MKFAHRASVILIVVGGNELEPLAIREILGFAQVDCLVPHRLESKHSGSPEVSVTTDVDCLSAVSALNFLVTVKFD